MASISISVNNDLFSINMDKYEWTSLEVNGDVVNPQSPVQADNLKYKYAQHTSGALHFIATADNKIAIVNPNEVMILEGTETQKTYVAVTDYTSTLQGITLDCWLIPLAGQALVPPANATSFNFTQGSMNGVFSRS